MELEEKKRDDGLLHMMQDWRGAVPSIYYLAHPWAFNPALSFENAVRWTKQLREMGHAVFSPILHTHPYWDRLKQTCANKGYIEAEDWVAWDLAILGKFIHPVVLMSRAAYKFDTGQQIKRHVWLSEGCGREYAYAKTHGIPVYELESFLEGGEVEL